MSRRLALAALLGASLVLNAWLLWRGEGSAPTGSSSAGSLPAGASSSPAVAAPGSAEAAASSFVAVVTAVEAARRSASAGDGSPPPSPRGAAAAGDAGEADEAGRVTRALLDELQCQLAREKAAEAWRKEADGIRAALLRDEPPSPQMREANLAGQRAQLADMLGIDESDLRVGPLAESLVRSSEEAGVEVRRLVAQDPPDWRAALEVVQGLYRQEDAAVHRAFGVDAAADWRLHEVEQRAAILAIGASLVGVPWSSVDDKTPPAAP